MPGKVVLRPEHINSQYAYDESRLYMIATPTIKTGHAHVYICVLAAVAVTSSGIDSRSVCGLWQDTCLCVSTAIYVCDWAAAAWLTFSFVSLHTASPSQACTKTPASVTSSGGP